MSYMSDLYFPLSFGIFAVEIHYWYNSWNLWKTATVPKVNEQAKQTYKRTDRQINEPYIYKTSSLNQKGQFLALDIVNGSFYSRALSPLSLTREIEQVPIVVVSCVSFCMIYEILVPPVKYSSLVHTRKDVLSVFQYRASAWEGWNSVSECWFSGEQRIVLGKKTATTIPLANKNGLDLLNG